jgi:hypothetical protein
VIPALLTPEPVTRDGARAAARAELSKAIYHRYDDPLPVRLLKDVYHWLAHAISTAADNSPGGPAGAVVLVILAVALVAVARWRLGPIRRDVHVRGAVLDETRRRAIDHRAAARIAAESGDWHTAVVERMRAVARQLEENGVVDPRPGRTADELAADAIDTPPATRAALAGAARAFDEVAYGGRAATEAAYRLVASADEMVAKARPRVVAAR